jgi:RND family efflux transporter MFP subunit
MRNIHSTISAILLLAATIGVGACSGDDSSTVTENALINVRLAEIESRQVPQARSYPGTVQGRQKVNISTKIMGTVDFLGAEEGSPVTRGQVLVRIRNADIVARQAQASATLREAEANLANSERQFRRIERLFNSESATKKEFEDASTRYEMAQARTEMVRGKLSEIEDAMGYTVLESPIDGVVNQKIVEEGDLAVPGRPLLVVESDDRLEVVALVGESDIDRFSIGDTTTIEIGAPGGRRLGGVVIRISPAGQTATRQFNVKMAIAGKTGSGVRSGMFARVILRKDTRQVFVVPGEALVTRGQLTGLFSVNEKGQAVLRWVRIGKRVNGTVEILSGLSEGEKYIISRSGRIVDGQPVTVLN